MTQPSQAFTQNASTAIACISCELPIIETQLTRLRQAIIDNRPDEYLGAKIAIGIYARRIIRTLEQIDDTDILAQAKAMY